MFKLHIVRGLPGSGKSTWVNTVPDVSIRLLQSQETRRLEDAVELVSLLIAQGETVALESWGWRFPDQDYPINRVHFANQPERCLANVIWDGIHRRQWCSGFAAIRLDVLLTQYPHYNPPPGSLPVYRRRLTSRDVEEFMRLYPNPHGETIRRLLTMPDNGAG